MASYKKRTQRKNGGRKRYASHSRRVKYGGVKPEDMDIETGISDLQSAEEGRSQTPPPPIDMGIQEEGQSEYNPDADQWVVVKEDPKDISKKVCLPKHAKEEKILSRIKAINISTEKVVDNPNLKQRSHLWPSFLGCKDDTYLDINMSDMK